MWNLKGNRSFSVFLFLSFTLHRTGWTSIVPKMFRRMACPPFNSTLRAFIYRTLVGIGMITIARTLLIMSSQRSIMFSHDLTAKDTHLGRGGHEYRKIVFNITIHVLFCRSVDEHSLFVEYASFEPGTSHSISTGCLLETQTG